MKAKERYCCFMDTNGNGCKENPDWEIWVIGGEPYDYVDSCDKHVGELLTDAQIHEIHRIGYTDDTSDS